jgi:cysteinyl-tRNA synthetase
VAAQNRFRERRLSAEIAQSECYLGHKWCNYWVHFGFLNDKNGKVEKISLIGGEKFKINQSNNSYININNPENDFHRNIIEWYKKEFERIEEVLK